jgi:hypothetical protein
MDFCDECFGAKDELCPICGEDWICADCEEYCDWCWRGLNGNLDNDDPRMQAIERWERVRAAA